MSGCPGYVGIVINDRTELEEIFRYDTLIFCPTTFNMTFHIPNRGQRMDRTFEVLFEDSEKSYSVYLTHMLFSEPYSQETRKALSDKPTPTGRWSLIVIIITSCLAALLLMNLMYAYLQLTKARAHKQSASKQRYYHKSQTQSNNVSDSLRQNKQLTECQYVFIVCYVVFRVVYSLLFSFTVFLAILVVVIESDTNTLHNIPNVHHLKTNTTNTYASSINEHAQAELLRQSELVSSMQDACSNYIQELFVNVQREIENASLRAQYSEMYAPDTSISRYVKDLVNQRFERYGNETTNYTEQIYANFTTAIEPVMHSYGTYLDKVFNNRWFQFPQDMMNNSDYPQSRATIFHESIAHGLGFDFGAYLEVEEVDHIQLWPVQWWER